MPSSGWLCPFPNRIGVDVVKPWWIFEIEITAKSLMLNEELGRDTNLPLNVARCKNCSSDNLWVKVDIPVNVDGGII